MLGGLIVGGSGFVGRSLLDRLGPNRGVGTSAKHQSSGLLQFDATKQRLTDLLPTLPLQVSHVFVLYGIVNPELCARDPEDTAKTNVHSIIRLLEDAFAASLVPVFVSTDYVFDGSRGMRREDERQSPTTEYGRQKSAVERWLQKREEPWLITRLSKVVGGDRMSHSVLGQWVNDIYAGRAMRSATDQIFSPADVQDIAQALVDLADARCQGIVHVAGEAMSRFDLNTILVDAVRRANPSVTAAVQHCTLREIPFTELRPLDTSLATERLDDILTWRFKSMQALANEVAAQHFGDPARPIGREGP